MLVPRNQLIASYRHISSKKTTVKISLNDLQSISTLNHHRLLNVVRSYLDISRETQNETKTKEEGNDKPVARFFHDFYPPPYRLRQMVDKNEECLNLDPL